MDDFDIEVYAAWWLEPYIRVLAFVCMVTNSELDEDKFVRVVQRALRLRPVFH
jgi:hypothetical protein